MDTAHRARSIDVLLFEDVNLLDVAGPVQAFKSAALQGRPKYHTRFVTSNGGPVRACCGLSLTPDGILSAGSSSDDLLVPGAVAWMRL